MFKICKILSKEINREEGTIPFILTERVVDRDSEVIEPAGVRLENFKKNPVFLWAHDLRMPPIGKILVDTLKVTKERLSAVVKFDLADPFAKMIFNKFADGFLSAGSIRFIGIGISKEAVLEGQRGVTFTDWELLEFSAVPVPANPDALAMKEFAAEAKSAFDDLKTFMEDDNFDHTPEGWIERQNKINESTFKGEIVDGKIKYKGVIYADASSFVDALSEDYGLSKEVNELDFISERLATAIELLQGIAETGKSEDEYLLAPEDQKFEKQEDLPENGFALVKNGQKHFPHHMISNGQNFVNWKGVADAMIQLLKSNLDDDAKKIVYEHLKNHYIEFNKQPPELDLKGEQVDGEIEIDDDTAAQIVEETIKLLNGGSDE